MADFSTLIASIEATIKENGVQAITGQVLQDELLLMVDAINQLKQDTLEGYAFYGEPLPNGATRVVTQNTFFLAGAGSYTINGNAVTITDSGISVIVYDCVNDEITTYQLFAYDANPTSGSGNAVTSGGVKSALDTKADKDGHYPDLFAGYAGNLVDTRSAGTPQGPYAFRQSGGDGVDYMVRIKGKTEAFNQIFNPISMRNLSISGGTYTIINSSSDTYLSFNVIKGHSHLLACDVSIPVGAAASFGFPSQVLHTQNLVNGRNTWLATSADTASLSTLVFDDMLNANSAGIEFKNFILIDLTLMYGAGYEPATAADQFQSLHPLPYYNYNAGVLKNNAATRLEATGFNQWDEEWEEGELNASTGAPQYSASRIRSKNYISVVAGETYYLNFPSYNNASSLGLWFIYDAYYSLITLGSTLSVTMPDNAAYLKFFVNDYYCGGYIHSSIAYFNDICINRSDASRNGIYEPYWKREIVLGLNNLACHDEDDNAVVVNGLDGVGSSYDEAVVENGMVTKIIKRFAEVDMGDLNWYSSELNEFRAVMTTFGAKYGNNLISSRYITVNSAINMPDKSLFYRDSYFGVNVLCVKDLSYSDVATFKTAVTGVKLRYELATPKVLTVDNPIPALIEVDNLGTERRLPEDTADNPQGGFESDSNYSVSVANLVRLLNS